MTTFVTLSKAFAIVGLVAVSSAPAHSRTCSAIKDDVTSINRQMISVAARFPGTTAGLAGCLASSIASYGDGTDGPGPALLVAGGCIMFVCWMSGSDNCMEVAGNYFLLGFQRADLETEGRREGCGQ